MMGLSSLFLTGSLKACSLGGVSGVEFRFDHLYPPAVGSLLHDIIRARRYGEEE